MSYFDVYRTNPVNNRPIPIRTHPSAWGTAVHDYFRYHAEDITVSLFEVTESGEKIREITTMKISEFKIGMIVGTPDTDSAVVCEIGTEFITCMWGDNNRRKYEPKQLVVKPS